MSNTVLTTKRLTLRKMRHDDMKNLMEIFSDREAMRYYPSTKGEKETNDWIEWTLANYENDRVGLWIVEDKKTGEFLGQCGIVPQEVEGRSEMEIGYLFTRRVWGNGYATEAALACKKFGFDQLKLTKIVSLCDIYNTPSTKVAERIGMRREKIIYKWGKEIAVYSVSI
ncbi:GNAT family N-acetyltransferase [Alteribacter populi]|uniref:GNAT family N-acetyltransferase n=1 Tax=Alteribacter populi TaxID=2011011 RepID=UPI000BBA6AF5|nr:GNAT family N-acetyltransferase [Alteribacter populi]